MERVTKKNRYGLTIYPPAASGSHWRRIGPYMFQSHRWACIYARAVSLGVPLVRADEVYGEERPVLRNRFVAVETTDLDGERYRLGRRVA